MQPQPPFNMLIVGMTGSGKTQFLLDMLETEYNSVFDYIIIVCPTIEWNTTYINWSHLSDNGVIQIPCSQEMINHVLKAVSTIFRGTNTLIIVDDCAASQAVKKRVSELVRLAYTTTALSSKALQREHFQASHILQPQSQGHEGHNR